MTSNYTRCAWKQEAEIKAINQVIGSIEVGYLEEMPQLYEGPFLLEERKLIEGMARGLGQYISRYESEKKFRENHSQLIEGQLALEDKNTALAELVNHTERERKYLTRLIQSNIDRIVDPSLSRLEAQLSDSQKTQGAVIRSAMNDLTTPFISRIEQGLTHLTPREVDVCHLIKNSFSSKEIAETLHTSEATVKSQRKAIRRKLGLSGSKVNLTTYLHQI